MQRRNPMTVFTSIVLVVFLFAPIVIKTLDAANQCISKVAAFTDSRNSSSKMDSQMPFEEKEKEENNSDTFAQLPLIYIVTEFIPYTSKRPAEFSYIQNTGLYFGTPIYLAKRSILI